MFSSRNRLLKFEHDLLLRSFLVPTHVKGPLNGEPASQVAFAVSTHPFCFFDHRDPQKVTVTLEPNPVGNGQPEAGKCPKDGQSSKLQFQVVFVVLIFVAASIGNQEPWAISSHLNVGGELRKFVLPTVPRHKFGLLAKVVLPRSLVRQDQYLGKGYLLKGNHLFGWRPNPNSNHGLVGKASEAIHCGGLVGYHSASEREHRSSVPRGCSRQLHAGLHCCCRWIHSGNICHWLLYLHLGLFYTPHHCSNHPTDRKEPTQLIVKGLNLPRHHR
mmetsp:Transcript_6097/g.14800  ORF Transcript_6097/g.14800 Transcript_6097/m.14800 type:complete len:272 (+) Transcript_6097:98-913(+)